MEVVYDRAIAGDTGAQCVILLAVGGNGNNSSHFLRSFLYLKLNGLHGKKRFTNRPPDQNDSPINESSTREGEPRGMD